MSLNAAALRILAEKGLSALDIVEVAEALEVRKDPTAATRMARHRAKKKADSDAEQVTRNVTTNTPLNDIYSNPPGSPQDISNEISPPISEKPNGAGLKPEHVVEAWNDMAARCDLPKAKLTPERQRKLRPFVRRYAIEDITEAIHAVERSRFCRGENDRGWRANIDFLLQPSSFTKLTEGTYDGTN